MTDEQKAQLKEQAKTEGVSPSYRHVETAETVDSTPSEGARSRGPSRSNPTYFGRIAIAANRGTACPRFNELMNVVLPCSEREAVAVFSSPPWVHRLMACTTHGEVIDVFRLYHEQCWSEEQDGTLDPVFWTAHGNERYKKIRRRLKFLDSYVSKYKDYPLDYGEDNFSSDDEPMNVDDPPRQKYQSSHPGDFVLTFGVIVIANSLESQFPHRSEYWWTQLEGTLDEACMCFSMQQWVDQLKTCEDEESFKITYQSFLNTTWQAIQGQQQTTNTFPFVQPTQREVTKAYYMKNRTLILHNQMVWGPGADEDQPVLPNQQERSTRRSSPKDTGLRLPTEFSEKRTRSGDDDGDDPNKRRPPSDPKGKGDESQDPTKKKDEKEATSKDGEKSEQSSADQTSLNRIQELERLLKEAREDAHRSARAAQEAAEAAQRAAEEKARRIGEELAQQIDDEKARKERKREASKEKKKKKKQKKEGATQAPPSDDDHDSDSPEEKDDEKPEGDSKKPEGDESKEKPEGESKKPEGDAEKPEG